MTRLPGYLALLAVIALAFAMALTAATTGLAQSPRCGFALDSKTEKKNARRCGAVWADEKMRLAVTP